MSERKIIQVEDKVPFKLLLPLSIQHMFAMFGASVLVPFIFGINPAIVLFMNGVNFDFYDSDQGEGAGILRFQLCISCTGRNRY
mgnify:CR=1 FL=1